MTHGQAKRMMKRLRDGDSHIVGEYREGETIEVHTNVLYERCFFYNCRFIGYGHSVFFYECTVLSATYPTLHGRWDYVHLENCLIGEGPVQVEV